MATEPGKLYPEPTKIPMKHNDYGKLKPKHTYKAIKKSGTGSGT